MKAMTKRKPMKFGDFVVAVYDACGKRRAGEIVKFAVNAQWVVLPGPQRLVIN